MKSLILVSIVMYWAPLLFIFWRWEFDSSKTISDHVSKGMPRILHTPTALISMVALFLYLVGFVFVELDIKTSGIVVLLVAVAAQILYLQKPRVASLIHFHDSVANVFAAALYVILLIISRSSGASPGVVAVVYAVLVILPVLTYLLHDRTRRRYLFYQVAFFATVHTVFVVVGFPGLFGLV